MRDTETKANFDPVNCHIKHNKYNDIIQLIDSELIDQDMHDDRHIPLIFSSHSMYSMHKKTPENRDFSSHKPQNINNAINLQLGHNFALNVMQFVAA